MDALIFFTIFLALSTTVFCWIHSGRGLGRIVVLYIFVFVLTENIDEAYYSYILEPSDWVAVLIFTAFIGYGLIRKRGYLFRLTWIDYLILLFLCTTVLLSFVINFDYSWVGDPYLVKFVYPVKIWLVYRVFFYIFEENRVLARKGLSGLDQFILRIIIYSASVSAIISILRYFPIPYLQDFIERTWPIITHGRWVSVANWPRLTATMSSTNGAGNFFAFTTLISLCQLRLTNEKKYIFFAVLFLTCVILTVSFSSFVALAVGIILFYKKQMNLKHVMVATLVLICSLSIISLSETFASIIQTRYDRQFIVSGSTWFLPANLFARLDYWRQHLEVLFSEDKLFFGFGISGIRIHLEKNLLYGHGNPESLYFRLISESGLAAVIMFVLMHRVIFKAIRALSTHRPFMTQLHLIKVILIMFLVANIGNQTMYYGGSLHLFCIMLTLIYFYEVKLSSFQIRGNARGGLRLRMQNRKPA